MSQQQPPNYPLQPQEPYQGQPQYQQPQQGFQGQPQQPYYPQQPMMPPPKKKHTGRNVLIAVIVVVVVLLAACGGIAAVLTNIGKSANTGTVVNSGSTSTTGNTQATGSTFKIGQTVSVGNTWQITVLSAKTDKGGQINTLQHAGDVFLVISVSVKNISSQSQSMSSALQWSIQDSSGQKYSIGIDLNAGTPLDGSVAAGRPLKGVLTYEIPANVKSFTLSFQNDITSTEQSIWDITV